MKKPYIKKIRNVAGYNFWYVNGYYIRKHLDRVFSNFGSHRNFDFIPKNEFWIDMKMEKKKQDILLICFLQWKLLLKMEKAMKKQ